MQSIIAEKRDILGKKVENLRRQGFLPAVVYGKKKEAEPVAVREIDFTKLWKSAGESTIVELRLGQKTENVLIQDVALDPLKDKPIHADFYVVEMDKPVKVDVPLEFVGESEAVRAGGILVKVLHELKIEALPKNLPHNIAVDLSALKTLEGSIKVKDLRVPNGVAVLDNLDDTVVMVEVPRAEEEVKAAETEAHSLESIEVVGKKPKAEGAAAAAEVAGEEKKSARPTGGASKNE